MTREITQPISQEARRMYLIRALLAEEPKYRGMQVPADAAEQKRLLHSLMNVRPPRAISENFLAVQNEYLRQELARKGVTDLTGLAPLAKGLYLWQGDITTLRCDAIVNAANSGMTGCYVPCHSCIDNCIHTWAGVQLRQDCAAIIREQGHAEEAGQAKITPGYNLPCKYILHTVGPIVSGRLRRQDEELLVRCYRSCLELAARHGIQSIAFCCISTGEFRFPNQRAAEIAVQAVKQYQTGQSSEMQVVFNVFKDADYAIYQTLLADR